MKEKLTTVLSSLIFFIGGYLLLSFAAWSFDLTQWGWVLRLILVAICYTPFNKKAFKKLSA